MWKIWVNKYKIFKKIITKKPDFFQRKPECLGG